MRSQAKNAEWPRRFLSSVPNEQAIYDDGLTNYGLAPHPLKSSHYSKHTPSSVFN